MSISRVSVLMRDKNGPRDSTHAPQGAICFSLAATVHPFAISEVSNLKYIEK